MSNWTVHLEFQEGTSSKFWRARVEDATLYVNYGKIGSAGQTQVKDFGSSDLATKDAYWRMLDHLKANEVNLDETKPTVGPLLKVDAKREMLGHADQVIADAANKCALQKREGRGAFKIPVMSTGAVASTGE